MQRGPVGKARRAAREARVGRERRVDQHDFAEAGEFALVLHAQEDAAAVARAKRAVRDDGGVVRAGARRGGAAIRGEIRGKAHPLAECFEHGDVERRSLPGSFTAQQRRENRGEGVHPGGDVRDRDARLARRIGRAGDRKQACFALH